MSDADESGVLTPSAILGAPLLGAERCRDLEDAVESIGHVHGLGRTAVRAVRSIPPGIEAQPHQLDVGRRVLDEQFLPHFWLDVGQDLFGDATSGEGFHAGLLLVGGVTAVTTSRTVAAAGIMTRGEVAPVPVLAASGRLSAPVGRLIWWQGVHELSLWVHFTARNLRS